MSTVGKGIPSYDFGRVSGTVRHFRSPNDVIESLTDDLESSIALVESGGTTFLSPILGRLGGVIARGGTLRSHLAIVSREFELPCLVGTELADELTDGDEVVLKADGADAMVLRAGADDSRGPEFAASEVDRRSVTEAWWDYIRRVGDEIAVKDFDVTVDAEALETLIAEGLDNDRLDDLIGHMGRTFKPEMTRRSAFASELFPMMPYIAMSMIEDFQHFAARIREIEAVMPAEEIGRRLNQAPNQVSPLWIWMVAYHYLCGRECLIAMGKLAPGEKLDEVRTVIDFWRRLTLAHRGDGTLDNKDAGFTNRCLPVDVVEELAGHASTLSADDTKALKRLNATATGYSFLYFCDSRVGICDSGPYPRPDGRETIVRDYLSLGPSAWDYPWAERLTPPYAGLTLVLVYEPRSFTSFEINDWGTTFTEPGQLLGAVTEAAVFGVRADGTSELVPPGQWAEITTELSREHMTLYQEFAAMDRQERILAATRMYSSVLRPFAAVAGRTTDPDWALSPGTAEFYPDPLDDDEQAGAIFGAMLTHDMPSAFSPIR